MQTIVLERGINISVNGKTFNNVIWTQLSLSYDIFGSFTGFAVYDYFTPEDVGIIKVRTEIPDLGSGFDFSACSDLVDYKIT